MKHWKAASAALISVGLMAQAAQAAAPLCTTQGELSSLRTAALQQQLMVAGLTCHASEAYNRFVLAYRPELQKSDAELKAYFIRRGGEHGEAEKFKQILKNDHRRLLCLRIGKLWTAQEKAEKRRFSE